MRHPEQPPDSSEAHARRDEPAAAPADPLAALLVALQRAVFRHPLAMQDLFATLVAQGRAYAETPEGAELAEKLSRSELVARSRSIWEAGTLGALSEQPEIMPDSLLEMLTRLVAHEGLEPLISAWFAGEQQRA